LTVLLSSRPAQEPIVITGISLISALGQSASRSWQRLKAGESAIKLQQPYPELPPVPLGLISTQPTSAHSLLSQLLTALLADAHLTPPLPECSVVIGSSRGLQQQWEAWLRRDQTQSGYADLGAWWQSLPQSLALAVAAKLQTQSAVLSPTAACATGIWALAQGKLLIESGYCQRVIVGAVESPITPLTLAGFARMGALCQTGAYPFDRQRQGFALAEGGALFLLETASLAYQRQAQIYGQILGVGLSADGYHLTAPEESSQGMIAAVKMCLAQAQVTPRQLDYIHAHGTGTDCSKRIK